MTSNAGVPSGISRRAISGLVGMRAVISSSTSSTGEMALIRAMWPPAPRPATRSGDRAAVAGDAVPAHWRCLAHEVPDSLAGFHETFLPEPSECQPDGYQAGTVEPREVGQGWQLGAGRELAGPDAAAEGVRDAQLP